MQKDVEIHIRYPLDGGRIVLRTDEDWDVDVLPTSTDPATQTTCFTLPLGKPFLYYKPKLHLGDEEHWSQGHNYLALADASGPQEAYPYFLGDDQCSTCHLRELITADYQTTYKYRIFYPPGYSENALKRYPVIYMQDGQNLFFPNEAFQGNHWRITETLTLLGSMNAIEPVIVVGVYPNHRMSDYTAPGYEAYGRFLVDRLKPTIDENFRTLPGPENTAVMGSSLGGVVSFYLAWQYPEVFGMAAAMSSTFGWRDNLRQRVAQEPKRNIRIYLDSGWPRDNYEVNRGMRAQLLRCGYRQGVDLLYLAFPEALHNETSWAVRSHIPFQFFLDRLAARVEACGDSAIDASHSDLDPPTIGKDHSK